MGLKGGFIPPIQIPFLAELRLCSLGCAKSDFRAGIKTKNSL
jgi:hypothetical protein